LGYDKKSVQVQYSPIAASFARNASPSSLHCSVTNKIEIYLSKRKAGKENRLNPHSSIVARAHAAPCAQLEVTSF
jgi:hypothetical protein